MKGKSKNIHTDAVILSDIYGLSFLKLMIKPLLNILSNKTLVSESIVYYSVEYTTK